MTYEEALIKVNAKVPKDNYMLISFSYDTKIVVPHKEGVAIVAAMKNAEMVNTDTYQKHRIEAIGTEVISFRQLSDREYKRHKIAAMLDITMDEAKQLETP